MEHTERPARHGGILYPLLLVAAIAVIVFSIIGIATMTGVVPNASTHDGAARQSGMDPKGKPATIEVPRRAPAPGAGNPRTASGVENERYWAVMTLAPALWPVVRSRTNRHAAPNGKRAPF
ncbi:MAG TPA: hypothetical protein VFG44_01640 [Burkholderiales bacterium]|jgi:hypothetical protein|nr:hypothetical protein [Burkholderiales bacterium]